MVLDIGRRYGVDLRQVPMVGDTLRDLQAAQAAGCEPHLVRSGRAAALERRRRWPSSSPQVPGTFVHADLGDLGRRTCWQREHAAAIRSRARCA